MICCVIGSAILSLLMARLATLPIVGSWFAGRRQPAADASMWRLEPHSGSGAQP